MPQAGSSRRIPLPPASTHPDQIVYLAFTSGTTGTPKGVMHSDNTLLANGERWWRTGAERRDRAADAQPHEPPHRHRGPGTGAGGRLRAGDARCLAGIGALDWIEQTGATYVMGVPTHAMDLLQEIDKRGLQKLGAVKVFYMAGAPIPTETRAHAGARRQAAERLRHDRERLAPVHQAERSRGGHHQHLRQGLLRLRGAPVEPENPDLEAGPGEVGEIGGRGGVLMLGYFNNQSATENSFNSSGWFLSGDLGRFDEQGNLQIVGRKKDLIIRGGHNIHPAHIEEYAHRHPA
jgi:acyl-CoA synthetase